MSRLSEPTPAPEIAPVRFLLGTWKGEGRGVFPTIRDFTFGEEVRFWHVGKPFLAYSQRTWSLDDERPLHGEVGYWRPQPDGGLEVVLAHPTGIAEIELGTVRGTEITLATATVGRTPSAKTVERLERRYRVDGDELTYELHMAAVGEPLQIHLAASLRREGP